MSPTPRVIPVEWLVPAHPLRIILHWTAGTYAASPKDRSHYHILVQPHGGAAGLVRGTHGIDANDSTRDGRYAAHTRGLNTGAIGVAICAMAGAIERPYSAGAYPILGAQWDALYLACADLLDRYRLALTPQTLCTHAEVAALHGVPQAGKWDITVDRRGRHVSAEVAGDEIRAAVARALRRPVRPAAGAPRGAAHG